MESIKECGYAVLFGLLLATPFIIETIKALV